MRRFLSTAVLAGSMLSSNGSAQEQPKELPPLVQKFLDKTHAELVRLLDSESYANRVAAEQALRLKSIQFIQEGTFIPNRELIDLKDSYSLEQKKRLGKILPDILAEEDRKAMQRPSIFKCPPAWNKPGHTVTMREALQTLAKATGQSINTDYITPYFLEEKVSTQGLDGHQFWTVFSRLQSKDQIGCRVTTNGGGALYAQQDYMKLQKTMTSSGALAGFLEQQDFFPSGRYFSIQTEPRFQIRKWKVLGAEMIHSNSKTTHLYVPEEGWEDRTKLSLFVPTTKLRQETVQLRLKVHVTAVTGKRVQVEDIAAKQTFHGETFTLHYQGLSQNQQGEYVVTSEVMANTGGLHPDMRSRFYSNVQANGRELGGVAREPEGKNEGGRFTWTVSKRPTSMTYYLPQFRVMSSEFVLVFPEVQLQPE